MPPIVIAGAIAGAGALGSAAVNASAASKAAKGATKAAAANDAILQQQNAQVRADLAPATATLAPATSALMSRLGLAPQSAAPTPSAPAATQPTAPAPAKTGMAGTMPAVPDTGAGVGVPAPGAAPQASAQPNWDQVLKDRPDVQAEYQRASSTADHNSPAYLQKGLDSPEHYAQYWYANKPAADTYQAPTPGQAATPAGASTPAAPVPGQTFTSSDNGGLGDRSALARPTFGDAQPAIGQGPTSADYLQNFQASPGYQFRLDQGIRNLNASYGARGLLKSDAAIKGINDYGQGQASQEYGNWFGQQMQRLGADQGQYNNDRTTGLAQYNQNRNVFNQNYNADTSRYDANFNSDRGYNTDQYNQYTGNLFQLAGMGQNAAAGTANAGANYANQATANNNNLASVKGNAAIAGANGINGAINSGLQAFGAYGNPFGATAGGSYTGMSGTGGAANPFGISFS